MAKLDDKDLLEALSNASDWVDAGRLAELLRVTPKTIYNHVRRLNERAASPLIESSDRGYRLVAGTDPAGGASTPGRNRIDAILGRLLGTQAPISIYDLADELYMADSTLQVELRRVREEIGRFGITLSRKRDLISLSGTERDKRRLINHLIASQDTGSFAAFAGSQLLNSSYESLSLIEVVSDVLRTHGLGCTDYGLNNIALHVIVMVDRLRQHQTVSRDEIPTVDDAGAAWEASQAICAAISETFGITTTDSEVYYLALTIALNTNILHEPSQLKQSIASYLTADELTQTREIVAGLERAYCLDMFDEAFDTRLALHFHDLRKRAASGSYVRNPLAARTKSAYPLVYDMAVFLANEFSRETGLTVNEDEIAFLAFHLGGYFEHNLLDTSKITCSLLYIGYHEMHLGSLEKINQVFGDEIAITNVSSISSCNLSMLSSDLVLTPIPLEVPDARMTLVVNPMLTREDLSKIRSAVDSILAAKRSRRMEGVIRQYLRPDLFRRNFYAGDRLEMIRALADDCIERGLCDNDFYEDVLQREDMSSTAIGNQVAIPHSFTSTTRDPFFSVVINDRPMAWGDQRVSMIWLIGISQNSRSSFRTLFNDILAILGDTENVSVLMGSTDYDNFIARLEQLIAKQHEDG